MRTRETASAHSTDTEHLERYLGGAVGGGGGAGAVLAVLFKLSLVPKREEKEAHLTTANNHQEQSNFEINYAQPCFRSQRHNRRPAHRHVVVLGDADERELVEERLRVERQRRRAAPPGQKRRRVVDYVIGAGRKRE